MQYCLLICGLITYALGSNWSCCITGLPGLVVKPTKQANATCVSYSYCSTIKYVSDALLLVGKNSTSESDAAILSNSFNSLLTKTAGGNIKGTLTVFAYFSPLKLQEMAEMISNALVQIIQHYSWTRMIVFADASDKFYVRVGELSYRTLSLNNCSVNYFQVYDNLNATKIVKEVTSENFKVVILSLSSQKAKKILAERLKSNLSWPQYAWIDHSVAKDKSSDTGIFEGVMELQVGKLSCMLTDFSKNDSYYNMLCNNSFSSLLAESVDIILWEDHKQVHLSNYSTTNGLSPVTPRSKVPSDAIPQRTPSVFIALYYLGILICFVLVTCTLVLYIHFRNEPSIKATSISLSILIFIGCYIWIFYLLILNSSLLPSYHRLTSSSRNFMCTLRVWLHGLGYPVALIMSTILVKLLRVYRIFHCRGKINVYTSGNLALAIYALILASPNALICLMWSSSDPYLSEQTFKTSNGEVVITEQCRSHHAIQWLLGLLIYMVFISVSLLLAATLTRSIQQEHFKDTKKVSALAYIMVLSVALGLSYWFIFRTIGANTVIVHGVLQLAHWGLIIQCQVLLFAPKLYPILKVRLMKKYDIPVSKIYF